MNEFWLEKEKVWRTKNTHKIADIKTNIALNFVKNARWTTPFAIDLLTQKGKRGFAKKLISSGFLQETELYNTISNMPRKILRLTQLGADFIGVNFTHISSLPRQTLWHDYITQVYTILFLYLFGFPQNDNVFYALFPQYNKTYDAVVNKHAIEIELNAKKEPQAHYNFAKIIQDIKKGYVNKVFFYSFRQKDIENYLKIVNSGKLKTYKRNQYGKLELWPQEIDVSGIKDRINFLRIPYPFSTQAITALLKKHIRGQK